MFIFYDLHISSERNRRILRFENIASEEIDVFYDSHILRGKKNTSFTIDIYSKDRNTRILRFFTYITRK